MISALSPTIKIGLLLGVCSLVSPLLPAEEKPPVAVQASHIQFQHYARPVRISGILAYKRQQTLSFKTTGPIEQLLVEEGDKVKKDQLLASLNLREINARVEEASARVLQARRNLDRYQQLHRTNALSLDRLQLAETDLRITESQLRIAKFNQDYSAIHAPADGMILQRHREVKEIVSPNQPILLLADETQGWVIRAGITDKDIALIHKNDPAEIRFDALPDQVFTGSVTQLGVIGNDKTGTFEIEISLPDTQENVPERTLRAGFVSQIDIMPSATRKVAFIPAMSIITSGTHSSGKAEVFVFNPKEQTAQIRQVTVEYIEQGLVAISEGLVEEDLLITQGAGLLRDGEKAKIISEAP